MSRRSDECWLRSLKSNQYEGGEGEGEASVAANTLAKELKIINKLREELS